MMKYVEGFNTRLLNAIGNKGMSNRQVSIITGIPLSCINAYVNENRMPCCIYLVKLAKLLDVSTDYLLGLEGGE